MTAPDGPRRPQDGPPAVSFVYLFSVRVGGLFCCYRFSISCSFDVSFLFSFAAVLFPILVFSSSLSVSVCPCVCRYRFLCFRVSVSLAVLVSA